MGDDLKKQFQGAIDGLTHPNDRKALSGERPDNVIIKRSNPTKNGDYRSYSAEIVYGAGTEESQSTFFTRKGEEFVRTRSDLGDSTYDYTGTDPVLEAVDSFYPLEEGFGEMAGRINASTTGRVVLYTDDGVNPPDRAEFDMSDLDQKQELFTRMGLITEKDTRQLEKDRGFNSQISEIIGEKVDVLTRAGIDRLSQYGTQASTPKK